MVIHEGWLAEWNSGSKYDRWCRKSCTERTRTTLGSLWEDGNALWSILCLPFINETKVTGVLYLENNLAPYVFTPDFPASINDVSSLWSQSAPGPHADSRYEIGTKATQCSNGIDGRLGVKVAIVQAYKIFVSLPY